MWTLAFWKDAAERAVKSAAQAPLLFWGAGEVTSLFTLDWQGAIGVAGGAALISLLTSVASAPFSNRGTASLSTKVTYNE